MSTIVEELVTVYTLKNHGYKDGAREVEQTTKSLSGAFNSVQEGAEKLAGGGLKGLLSTVDDIAAAGSGAADAMGPLGIVLGTVVLGGVLIVTEALKVAGEIALEATKEFIEFATKAEEAYGRIFDFKASLTVLTGSAEEAAKEFERLEKISQLPGLNLDAAEAAAAKLMSAGASAQMAERMIREFGNAVAIAGGHSDQTKEVLDGMARAMSEGVLRGRSMLLMFREMPGVAVAMKAAFGTTNSRDIEKLGLTTDQFLARLLPQLEAMPRAIAGPTKAMEDLKEAGELAWASMGESIDKDFRPAIERVTTDVQSLIKGGAFQEIAEDIAMIFGGGGEGTADLLSTVLAASVATMQTLAELASATIEGIEGGVKSIAGAVLILLKALPGASLVLSGAIASLESLTFGGVSAAVDVAGMWKDHFDAATDMMDKGRKEAAADAPPPGAPAPVPPLVDPHLKQLEEIAAHTARMAELQQRTLDLRRMLAGGGDILAHTLSNADIAGLGSQGSRARVTKIAEAITDVIQAELTEALKRQGRLRHA